MFAKKKFAEKKFWNLPKKIYLLENIKFTKKQGQSKVKVRWRESNHNLDLNYNLMGFDTIEINLVVDIKCLLLTYDSHWSISKP